MDFGLNVGLKKVVVEVEMLLRLMKMFLFDRSMKMLWFEVVVLF